MNRTFGYAVFLATVAVFPAGSAMGASGNVASSIQPAPISAHHAATKSWLGEWDGFLEVQLRPALGRVLDGPPDQPWIDDSEYEGLIRVRRSIDRLRGIRLQLQAGGTNTPNIFDGEAEESGLYGEVQLGDTYVPFSELRHGNFRKPADDLRRNAVRPYARYRHTWVYDGWLDKKSRRDQRGTLGLRYRRVPHLVERTYTEDDIPQPMQVLPGFYFETRAEVSRVWSTKASEELWNPRLQLDLYSPPFISGTRVVLKATGEKNYYDVVLAPNGKKRVDTRLRISAGLDISAPLTDLFDLPERRFQAELLARYQARWSNDPEREHERWYFVPSVTLTVPLQ